MLERLLTPGWNWVGGLGFSRFGVVVVGIDSRLVVVTVGSIRRCHRAFCHNMPTVSTVEAEVVLAPAVILLSGDTSSDSGDNR